MTAATSKYVSVVEAGDEHDRRPRPGGERADRDQRVHRRRECRALCSAARWKPSPLQKTTGVARASATHSQPAKWSGGTIARAQRGGESDRDDESAPQQGERLVVRVAVRRPRPGVRGIRPPRPPDEIVDGHGRVAAHRHLLGGEVHDASTPSSLLSFRSMRATHDAHVMPSRSSRISFRSVSVAVTPPRTRLPRLRPAAPRRPARAR